MSIPRNTVLNNQLTGPLHHIFSFLNLKDLVSYSQVGKDKLEAVNQLLSHLFGMSARDLSGAVKAPLVATIGRHVQAMHGQWEGYGEGILLESEKENPTWCGTERLMYRTRASGILMLWRSLAQVIGEVLSRQEDSSLYISQEEYNELSQAF